MMADLIAILWLMLLPYYSINDFWQIVMPIDNGISTLMFGLI